eukprot:1067834-Ditylum_brightwellii.AAC.1
MTEGLLDSSAVLFKSIKKFQEDGILKARDVKPTLKHFKLEIQRQARLLNVKVKFKNWLNKPILGWLREKKLADFEASW